MRLRREAQPLGTSPLDAITLELLPDPSMAQQARRRSEVDRKLDGLVGASGKLREASPAVVVKFLRLFNLCDFSSGLQGTTSLVRSLFLAQFRAWR